MHARTILENLDNGAISRETAAALLGEHEDADYLAGAYIESRQQRDDYMHKLHALQDGTPEYPAPRVEFVHLVDHAYATGHVTHSRAISLLRKLGMDAELADHHVDILQVIAERDMERANYLEFPKSAPRYCTRCGRMVTAKELSRRGICVECSSAAVEENLIALDTKTGPAYTRWRDAMLKLAYTLEDQKIAERHAMDPLRVDNLIDHDKPPPCFGDYCGNKTCKHSTLCLLGDIDPDTWID